MQKLAFHLADTSFTLLHRTGLAGLYMALSQLTKEQVTPPEGLTWELKYRQIILSWQGHDLTALNWLLAESFQLNDGLIALRGLNYKTMREDAQIIVHQGILGTFLQHNSTHKSLGTRTKSLQFGGEDAPEIQVTYKALERYVYQEFANNLCDRQGNFLKQPISVAGWLNPGAVVRHVAFAADTSFEESPENAFVLLFAPVACYYYTLRSRLRDKRSQYALVVPEIIDLQLYAKYRQNSNLRNAAYQDFYACGLGDAGLRFLTYETTAELASTFKVSRCQVFTLGTVAWATQQKTRTDLYVVEADAQICRNYQVCRNWLADKIVEGKDGNFVASSFAREMITDNLARSLPWYAGMADKVNSNELFQRLTYERGGLYQVVQKVQWDEERERLFVQACHEALSFIFGQINSQVESRSSNLEFQKELRNSLIKRESVRIRSALGRCRNAATFREFIVDFFARAGRVPTLKQKWMELDRLIMASGDWKRTRDLALLALASYPGKEILDESASASQSEQDGDQELQEDLIDIGL